MEDNKIPKLGLTPAFPSEYSGSEKDEFGTPVIVHRMSYGMSKRLYIATQITANLYSSLLGNIGNAELTIKQAHKENKTTDAFIVELAYGATDELLRQENL